MPKPRGVALYCDAIKNDIPPRLKRSFGATRYEVPCYNTMPAETLRLLRNLPDFVVYIKCITCLSYYFLCVLITMESIFAVVADYTVDSLSLVHDRIYR